MKHLILSLALVFLWLAPPEIAWDHDGTGVSYFNCVVDGTTTTNVGKPTPVGQTYAVALSSCVGVMVAGTHSVVIQACDVSNYCLSAAAITVVKL